MKKKAFDIDLATELIEEAVKPWPKAAMFELAEAGFNSTFEQLAACMISIRTYDEMTIPTARRLFEQGTHTRPDEQADRGANRYPYSFVHVPRTQGRANPTHRAASGEGV